MAHLIDKDALVAEIERRLKFVKIRLNRNNSYTEEGNTAWKRDKALYDAYIFFLSFIDTLEAKVVDLDKEMDLVEDKYHGFESLSRADIIEIIKHFFELGMQVSNKAKNIWHDANEKLPTGVIVVNNGGNLHIGWSTDEGDGIEDEHGRLITKTYQKWAREEDLT